VTVWSTLAWFLFGTIFGWWVLFIIAFLVSLPVIHRYRAWVAMRRFMRAEGQKFANPQNADARYQLAEIYAASGNWRRAAAYAEEAVAIAGTNPLFDAVPYGYLRCLGRAQYGRRRYAESAATYERALKAKSDLGYADALLGLAKARWRLREPEKALEFAKHAVAEQQSLLEAYFRWAQAAAQLGREPEVTEARRQFRKVAAALPAFAGKQRLRWRLAFATFPLSRHVA
jgi:tetratricopeptide (TPR) repeat protein